MREGTKVGRTVGGVTSIEGRLVNFRAPDKAIYLHTIYLHTIYLHTIYLHTIMPSPGLGVLFCVALFNRKLKASVHGQCVTHIRKRF